MKRLLAQAERLRGQIPVRIEARGDVPAVLWRDLGDLELSDPFFKQTVERAQRARPDGEESETSLLDLIAFERAVPGLEPSGFIFHPSRCGSTLVANALRSVPGSLVLSEPVPLLQALWLAVDGGAGVVTRHRALHAALVRALVHAMGQRRLGTERRYFIKFSHWNTLLLPFLREAFPDVPWVFLHRDPVEVMVSNLRTGKPLRETIPSEAAPLVFGVEAGAVPDLTDEETLARLIGRSCEAAAEEAGVSSTFLDYEDLSRESLVRLLGFFGIQPSIEELGALDDLGRLYSKDPEKRRLFTRDSAEKQAAASPLVREMAERYAEAPYRRVRALSRDPRYGLAAVTAVA